MSNLIKAITDINFKDKKTGYEVEYAEHYESVLSLVNDPNLARQIVRAIEQDHKKENPNYYDYLEKMEKEMKADDN